MRSTNRPPRRLRLAACLALLGCLPAIRPAAAQAAPWGWGLAGNPTANWSPEAVADYLLTGQTPHPAVCRIVAPEQAGTSLGSGVLVDVNRAQGLVLTNWHVIRESRSAVLVQFPDGFQSAGTVIRWDEAWDLAAIVIWKPSATPVSLAAADPTPGEPLTIAGFGRGTYREETGGCTEYLSPGSGYPKEFVELQATARQGDSGGPIFNERRELAGLLFGQNGGRTIGSCSSRVRTFLASAGSRGFTPTPIAEFSDAKAVDRSLGVPVQPQVQLASAVDGSVQRSTMVPGPAPPLLPGMPPPVFAAAPPAPGGDLWAAVRPILDPFNNGPALLSMAGGLALVFLGLRTIFGGRRRPPVNASESW
jgi:S1-C subfamily serine protease